MDGNVLGALRGMEPTSPRYIQAVQRGHDGPDGSISTWPDVVGDQSEEAPKTLSDATRTRVRRPPLDGTTAAAALPAQVPPARAQGKARKATGRNTRQRAPSSINDVVLTLLLCDHLLAAGRGMGGNSLPPIPYSVLGTVQRDRALVVLAGLCQREKRVKAEPDIPSQPGRGPCRLGGPPSRVVVDNSPPF